jgi:hypothetical protein
MVKTNLLNSNKLDNSQCVKNLKDTIVSASTLNRVRIACGLESSVSEEYTASLFRRLSEDGGSMFIWNSIHTR